MSLFFPRKVVGTNFQKFKSKSHPKIKRQMIQICAFKEKGKEGGEGRLRLGGQWKVPSLVAFGRF